MSLFESVIHYYEYMPNSYDITSLFLMNYFFRFQFRSGKKVVLGPEILVRKKFDSFVRII